MRFFSFAHLSLILALIPSQLAGQKASSHPLAPAFTLTGVSNRTVSLADYKGKVVIVSFWKSSCLLCDREVSILSAILGRHSAQGLVVIGISTEDLPAQDRSKDGYAFVRGDKKTIDRYGSPIAPATFLIGKDGRIYSKHSDYVSSAALETEIGQLLAADGSSELVGFKASGQAEKIHLPSEQELNTEIPGIDVDRLSPAQIKTLEASLDAVACPCGCGNTMLSCRRHHGECAMSREAAQREWKKLQSQSN